MSVRYRLFLWVSGVFVFVATISYFLENYITRRKLDQAQEMVREKILQISEKRRLDIQSYLAGSIVENQVRIDAVLQNIASFSTQALRFAPTEINQKMGTWGNASDLILEYQWVDFLQNTNQGQSTAEIIPQRKAIDPSYRIAIDQDLSWIYIADSESHPEPYLGIRIPYSETAVERSQNSQEQIGQVAGAIPSGFLLFDPIQMGAAEAALQSSEGEVFPPLVVKWIEGYQIEVNDFVKAFQRARALCQNKALQPPRLTPDEIKSRLEQAQAQQGGQLNPVPDQPLLYTVSSDAIMKERLELVALRYTQYNLIWVMIAMYETGIFGKDPFMFPAPAAAAVFADASPSGVGILTDQVLYSNKIFDDQKYFESNPPKGTDSHLATSIAVFPSVDPGGLFLGNTATFTVQTPKGLKSGYLTLGTDASLTLQRLMMAVRQTAVLVHQGAAIKAYGDDYGEIPRDKLVALPIATMLQNPSGLIQWENTSYFYMHLQPFPSIDLHFFLLVPEEEEFALLRDLVSGSKQVVDSILFNIHLLGLAGLLLVILLLHNISRKMTRPIIQLAKATQDVVEGRLDQIQLSLPPKKHQDEIAVLCHSFEEMVKGLQEKEKVKGVLNKVVSREIAQEILKGTVHLGGEEKKVTILFADIRDFTRMTQNMPPKDVIELLNVCMTKISQAVDKNSGVIDKYVGDEAMALFGAPISGTQDAYHAVLSALEMIDALKKLNEARKVQSLPPIEIGVGIHTGEVLAGNMGAEDRLNYTVIGSGVNLASRLCSAAKRMEILITKQTLEEPGMKEKIVYEELPPATFKGFEQQMEIYRVLGVKR